jgi:acylphosphatase
MTAGAEIHVRGMVQGVGFRYFCCTHARTFGLAGWVKNDEDGSVIVMVEGERSAIKALIDELRIGPANASVSAVDIRWLTYTGNYQTFQITH